MADTKVADRTISRIDLLERVNKLNVEAVAKGTNEKYWTVTVLYNTVIFCLPFGETEANIFEVYKGVAT